MAKTEPEMLQRELNVPGAVLVGLGSILGTGVFVSLAIAAGIAGPSVVLAVAIAALVAACNGLNSAQLAANHPVSGGTYEYGYRYLNPWLGFTAGWLFLLAKTASAATAALGFAGYLLNIFGMEGGRRLTLVALVVVAVMTVVVLRGIQRSNRANVVIVSVTLLSLGVFVLAGLAPLSAVGLSNFTPFFPTMGNPVKALLHATALMFVAYTGYGRIATLGEEVQDPQRTIPRSIIVSMVVTMLIYLAVTIVGVGTIGASQFSAYGDVAAPLELTARTFGIPGVGLLLAIGAMTAMLGVLLNLILGLSRVLLAMGRRGDMPAQVTRLNREGTSPTLAVVVMGGAIGLLVLFGNIKTTWSFSAFTVLIYYAITNFAALRLPASDRLYPKWLAWAGLVACLFLAFWVEFQIWLIGIGLILIGLWWKQERGGGR